MQAQSPSLSDPAHELVAMADRCVMCGLCLPHCPSYRVRPEEGDSPRGRVQLARALAQGRLESPESAFEHLDRCLACGTCETVCPAHVPFLDLLDRIRARQVAQRSEPAIRRWVRALLRRPKLVRTAVRLARLASSTGLTRVLGRMSPQLGELNALAAGVAPQSRFGPPRGGASLGNRGDVVVFQGCVGSVLDADTLASASHSLARLGYRVRNPSRGHCCGALARHVGSTQEADGLAGDARDAIGPLDSACLVGTSSGCQSMLAEAVARPLGGEAKDVLQLLADDPGFAGLHFEPIAAHAAVLVPCTHAGGTAAIRVALAPIPGLQLTFLPAMPSCCGAAGTFFADQPGIARALRAERVEQLRHLAPDLVLTTNVGCRLYLQAGLHEVGLSIPVLHPITLVARSLAE